jgi:hypothetical protein
MRTALDTNVLLPIWSAAPLATAIAAQLSKVRAEGALVISGPVFVELSAVPGLNVQLVRNALAETAITIDFDLEEDVWMLAAELCRLCRSPAPLRRRFSKTPVARFRNRGTCPTESRQVDDPRRQPMRSRLSQPYHLTAASLLRDSLYGISFTESAGISRSFSALPNPDVSAPLRPRDRSSQSAA